MRPSPSPIFAFLSALAIGCASHPIENADATGPSAGGTDGSATSSASTSGSSSETSETSASSSSESSGSSASSSAGVDSGASNPTLDGGKPPGMPAADAVVIDPGTVHQHISGFGASSAWEQGYQNTADPATLFSTTSGAGLSLFRVRIQPSPAGTTSSAEISMALTAQSMGVTVWATPWTPPAADKSNDSTVEGTLTNPSAWASTLASYVTTMKTAGINLYAVSSQNEPDAMVTYESCSYTGATLASFVGSYMGPALADSGVKVMTPETQNWTDFGSFESALVANSAAWSATSIVATHEYGGSPSAYPAIQAAGKEFWETEWYALGAEDATMTNGLTVATEIYQALTVANMNAWHYWWFYPDGSGDNQGLWDFETETWAKRLWVLGNFSRWVRPGYYRIDVAGTSPPTGISVIAFQNPADATVVIVVINTGGATSLPLFVSGAYWPSQVVPWITSASDNLVAGTPITLTSGNFTAPLTAQSVTTFVGSP